MTSRPRPLITSWSRDPRRRSWTGPYIGRVLFLALRNRALITAKYIHVGLIVKQEAFEKCWAHSLLRAVLHCHSSGVATATPVARRLRIDVHDDDDDDDDDNNGNDNA